MRVNEDLILSWMKGSLEFLPKLAHVYSVI